MTAASTDYQGREYRFCCEGCVTPFLKNPKFYLGEIEDMVICPTCLGEKTREQTLCFSIKGESFYFCRCPCCINDFKKSPVPLESLIQKRPES
jgi:YHS domain-containing protein